MDFLRPAKTRKSVRHFLSTKKCLTLFLGVALALDALPLATATTFGAIDSRDIPRSGMSDPTSLIVPETLGHVIASWKPADHPPSAVIIHLQDLHAHSEAQTRLSELIGYLRERFGLSLVAVEGAQGRCDTAVYSDLPDPPSTERIARLFKDEGLFTGAEYYAITHPGRVTLWGIEDAGTYLQHLAAYQRGRRAQSAVEPILR